MKISNKLSYGLFISVIVLLMGALVFSAVTIHRKNEYISVIKAQIASNETVISEQEAKAAELEEKLQQSNEENDKLNSEKEKLNSQLEETKSSKEKLEKENSKLKTELENLKAKRAAEAKAAINAANSASSSAATTVQPATPTGKICYLTFDDGPSQNTLKILDILAKYNAKATFFVINTSNIGYVKNIQAAGHTIGLHSASHTYSQIYKSTDAYFADLKSISDKVESLTGIKSTVIRFPGGSSNSVSKKYCKGIMTTLVAETTKRGYSYFDWNVSSGDAEAAVVSYTKIVNNVLNGAKGKNNICVLMHDAPGKTTTVDALPYIIEGLQKQGFSFCALTPQSPGFRHGSLYN